MERNTVFTNIGLYIILTEIFIRWKFVGEEADITQLSLILDKLFLIAAANDRKMWRLCKINTRKNYLKPKVRKRSQLRKSRVYEYEFIFFSIHFIQSIFLFNGIDFSRRCWSEFTKEIVFGFFYMVI